MPRNSGSPPPQPPTITCPSINDRNTDPGVCTASVTFSTTTTGSPDVLCKVSGGALPINLAVTSPYNFPKGTTFVTCTATNLCGTNACTFSVTVNDTEAPLVNCGQNETLACGLAWGFTVPIVTDNCDGLISMNAVAFSTETNFNGCAPHTFTAKRVWRAEDSSMNVAWCTQVVTVVDFTPPTTTCPPGATVSCLSAVPAPDISLVTATDPCNDSVPVVTHVSDVISGTAPRILTRTYKATDLCNNMETCTQVFTENDTTPPAATCPASFSLLATGPGGAAATYASPTVTDCNPPAPAVTCNPPSGSTFPIGATTVTCSTMDAAGNPASCQFTITVTNAVLVGLQAQIDAAAPGSTVMVAPGTYGGITINKNLTLDCTAGGVVVTGASPALTVTMGVVDILGGTYTTATDDPTVLVTGGSLKLRQTFIEESPLLQVGIVVTGTGTLDLGTPGDPGLNTNKLTMAGLFLSNATATAISAVGNEWRQDGTVLTSNFTIEDKIHHRLDDAARGLVTYVANNVYVTTASGSIQRGVDAIAAGGTVNVSVGTFDGLVSINKNLTLLSENGRTGTTLQNTAGTGLGAVVVVGPTTGVRIGDLNRGFTILGIDGPAGLEKSGIYWQGNHNNGVVAYNEVVAGGDSAMTTEFSAAITNLVVTNNIFSGQTFIGPFAGDLGFGNQFTSNNVPRQAVLLGGGSGGGSHSNITFSCNTVLTVSGGLNPTNAQQGNTLVTIDAHGATVTYNTFAGVSTRFAESLRTRGPRPFIYGNTFSGGTPKGITIGSSASSTAAVNNNNIASTFPLGALENAGVAMNARSNWWGHPSGPIVIANPNPGSTNSGASGGIAIGNIAVSPWYAESTDTSMECGFQPNEGNVVYLPASIGYIFQPGSAVLGNPLAPQPKVEVRDETGSAATQYQGPVTLSIGNNPSGGTLVGLSTVNAVNGVATFSGLSIDAAGAGYTLVASVPSLPSATSVAFNVLNPDPILTSISPTFALTNSPGFTLTLNGSGASFTPASVVLWEGSPRTTTFVNANQLTAGILASDLTAAGTYILTVFNPAPGGGTSSELEFEVRVTPSVVYVDDDFTPMSAGGHLWGYDGFADINQAIAGVLPGGTVNVAAGTYAAASATKPVTLLGANSGVAGCSGRGAESTIAGGAGTALTVASDDVTVDGFEMTGEIGISSLGRIGVIIRNNKVTAGAMGINAGALATTAMKNLAIEGNCIALAGQLAGSTPTIGLYLSAVSGAQSPVVSGNAVSGGFYGYMLYNLQAAAPTVVSGGTITGVKQGVAVLNIDPVTLSAFAPSSFGVSNIAMSGFTGDHPASPANNFHAGVYVFSGGPVTTAKLTGRIANVTVDGTGKISADSAGVYLADFSTGVGERQDLILEELQIQNNLNRGMHVRGSNALVSVARSTLTGNGADPFGAGGNPGFGLIARNNARVHAAACSVINPAAQVGFTVTAIAADADTNPLGPTLTVRGCSISNNGNPSGYLARQSAGTLDASQNWWGGNLEAAILAGTIGVVDFTPFFDVGTDVSPAPGFQPVNTTLRVSALGAQTGATGRIQEAIDAGATTILVGAGTFIEDVNVNRVVTLQGAGAGSSIVSGAIGGDSATLRISAAGPVIDGFTITREGNNVTDWNNPSLNVAGVAVQGLTVFGTVQNCIITGNRNGIDINNSTGNVVRNSAIVFNRTGLILRNQTDNTILTGNDITNNWTVGVLFLDASIGVNVPVQQALNSSFSSNNIVANWYGGIVDRQSGGSLPAPGTSNLKNFSANWLGTTTPVVTTANTTEPGYSAQIPVEYGGSASNPGGAPDIAGSASANFDYTPMLTSGTDTAPALGFQGDFATLHVTAASAQTGASGRIQEGINLAGSTVKIQSGTYAESPTTAAASVTLAPGASPGQVIVNGDLTLDGSDTLEFELNGTTAGTGYDQFVVNGIVTLGGATLSATAGFTYADCDVLTLIDNDGTDAVSGTFAGLANGATVVIGGQSFKLRYDAGTGNDVVLFKDVTAPVFTVCPGDINACSPGGGPIVVSFIATASDTCGATVTCSPASGSMFPVGTTPVSCTAVDPAGNTSATCTFNVSVHNTPGTPTVVYVDDGYVGLPGCTPVNFPYTGAGTHYIGYDAFTNITQAIAAVPAGGTVNVASGTYIEDVLVNKVITLQGADAATTILSGAIGGDSATLRISAAGPVIDGFTITRQGNNTTDWNNPALNVAGVAVQGLTVFGTVQNCIITGNRNGIDINNSTGNVVRNSAIVFNRTGLILRNQTDNTILTGNDITNNWTVGVLFLDASIGVNVPVQQALNSSFSSNNIVANWYGGIVDRQSGGSLPAPGTSNLKNFSANWLGTTTPVVTTANTTEPGYASQIPVEYGGSASNPGGAPDIAGPASANFDYTPMLTSGTDTAPALGFQGNFQTVQVVIAGAQTGPNGRIQEGVLSVSGSTVLVGPGLYSDNVVITNHVNILGSGNGSSPAVDSIVNAANSALPVISIVDAGGANAGNRLRVESLRLTGGSSGLSVRSTSGTHEFYQFASLAAVNNTLSGLDLAGTATLGQVSVSNGTFTNNGVFGLQLTNSLASFTGLEISSSTFADNGSLGLGVYGSDANPTSPSGIHVRSSVFARNGSPASGGDGDVTFFKFNGDASVEDVTITGDSQFPLQFRGKGAAPVSWLPAGTIGLTNVVINGTTARPGLYIVFYSDVTGITFANVDMIGHVPPTLPSGFASSMQVMHSGVAPLQLGDLHLASRLILAGTNVIGGSGSLALLGPGGAVASCQTVISNAYTPLLKELSVYDFNDTNVVGDVVFPAFNLTLPAPASVTVECTNAAGNIVTYSANAVSDCVVTQLVCFPASGSVFPPGFTPVSCTAYDTAGNSNSASFTVTVQDTTPPFIACLPIGPFQCLADVPAPNFGGSVAGDSCDPNVLFSVAHVSDITNGLCPMTITRTWRATDSSGNTNDCAQVITVNDTTPPALTCPANITTAAPYNQCSRTVIFSAPASDNCTTVNVLCTPASGSTFALGSTPVNCVATDGCGNTTNCSFTVTVLDIQAPMVSTPVDATVECSAPFAPAQTGTATAMDTCDPAPVIAHTDAAPVEVLASNPAEWFTAVQTTATATFTDGPGAPPLGTGSLRFTTGPGSGSGGKAWLINTNYTGRKLSELSELAYSTYVSPASTASPAVAGAINLFVDFLGTGATFATLVFEPTYSPEQGALTTGTWQRWNTLKGRWWSTRNLTNANGTVLVCSFNCFVPWSEILSNFPNARISGAGVQFLVGQNGLGAPWAGFDGAIDALAVGTNGLTTVLDLEGTAGESCPQRQTVVRTWTATDASGNVGAASQFIHRVDTTAPSVTCPASFTVTTASPAGTTVSFAPGASDNCDGSPVITCVPASGSFFPPGPSLVSCTAADACGNVSTSCTFTVTVNRTPIARDNGAAMRSGTTTTLALGKLLANDSDPDGDPITVVSVSATSTNGGAVVLGPSTVSYTPLPGFTGVDRFSYTISDGRGGTATAEVEVLVVSSLLPSQNTVLIQPVAGGVLLRFAGIPGKGYQIQRSTDLMTWAPIHTTVAPLHGIIEYFEPTAMPAAFYRTIEVP